MTKRIEMDARVCGQLLEGLRRIERLLVCTPQPRPQDRNRMRVDAPAACRYLGVSGRTLQRLRSSRRIAYTLCGGKSYYTIGEIRRVLQARGTEYPAADFGEDNAVREE